MPAKIERMQFLPPDKCHSVTAANSTKHAAIPMDSQVAIATGISRARKIPSGNVLIAGALP